MSKRNKFLDNAKGLAIFLVILGHILTSITNNSTAKVLYLVVNSIHIPLFVMISGMLTKVNITYKDIIKYVKSILVPFLIFDILYELYHIILNKHISFFILGLAPYWLMWYMLALFVWRMLLPIFSILKYSLTISIIISIILGYISGLGEFLNISKTFFFFPFFLIGFYLSETFFLKKRMSYFFAIFVIILISSIYVLLNNSYNIHIGWVLGNFSYSEMGIDKWYSGIFRLLFYFFSFLISWAVISLIPNKKIWLTKIGEKSLYIYLWHGFIILALRKFHFMKWLVLNLNIYWTLLILFCFSFIITSILSSNFFSYLTTKIFQNVNKDLIKEKYLYFF